MNYVTITTDEILQGEGLRVALWTSGCEIRCKGCHNYHYWDKNFGKKFDDDAFNQICKELDKEYISGLSVLGGNPTDSYNIDCVTDICKKIKQLYPQKNIWLFSGHKYEYLKDLEIIQYIDVLVDGEFIEELADINYPYAGSTNQRVIDIRKTIKEDKVILYECNKNREWF